MNVKIENKLTTKEDPQHKERVLLELEQAFKKIDGNMYRGIVVEDEDNRYIIVHQEDCWSDDDFLLYRSSGFEPFEKSDLLSEIDCEFDYAHTTVRVVKVACTLTISDVD